MKRKTQQHKRFIVSMAICRRLYRVVLSVQWIEWHFLPSIIYCMYVVLWPISEFGSNSRPTEEDLRKSRIENAKNKGSKAGEEEEENERIGEHIRRIVWMLLPLRLPKLLLRQENWKRIFPSREIDYFSFFCCLSKTKAMKADLAKCVNRKENEQKKRLAKEKLSLTCSFDHYVHEVVKSARKEN